MKNESTNFLRCVKTVLGVLRVLLTSFLFFFNLGGQKNLDISRRGVRKNLEASMGRR